jgi:hypothetical protein
MTVSWVDPARELVDRLGVGLEALWSLIFSAQVGALQLATVEPLDRDFALSQAGLGLADALAELEWLRPELAGGVAVDLGQVPWNDVIAYRETVQGLLAAALQVTADLLRSEQLETADLFALARVVHLIGAAHQRVSQ